MVRREILRQGRIVCPLLKHDPTESALAQSLGALFLPDIAQLSPLPNCPRKTKRAQTTALGDEDDVQRIRSRRNPGEVA